MARIIRPSPVCPVHGKPTKRSECRLCNAAYMRDYMWRRRQLAPDRELWARAKKRAQDRNIPFNLVPADLVIPPRCPVLGIPLTIGGKRSHNSPSLDRVDPLKGYVKGNVRVISDKANRLKGDRTLPQVREGATRRSGEARADLLRIAEYIEREELLAEVLAKADRNQPGHEAWEQVAQFLERVFSRGQLLAEPVEDDSSANELSDLQRFILSLSVPNWDTV